MCQLCYWELMTGRMPVAKYCFIRSCAVSNRCPLDVVHHHHFYRCSGSGASKPHPKSTALHYLGTLHQTLVIIRADSRFAPSQWETSLQSNAVSRWLGANLESALIMTKSKRYPYYWPYVCVCVRESLAESPPQRASNAELWCFLCCWANRPDEMPVILR